MGDGTTKTAKVEKKNLLCQLYLSGSGGSGKTTLCTRMDHRREYLDNNLPMPTVVVEHLKDGAETVKFSTGQSADYAPTVFDTKEVSLNLGGSVIFYFR